jgi:hypothetical protein
MLVMERERDCVPVVPHDLVQADQAPNAVVSQWIGHGSLLHSLVSSVCGQASPPKLGTVYVRVRVCELPPHDTEHADQPAVSAQS